jgi:hypothetical protein
MNGSLLIRVHFGFKSTQSHLGLGQELAGHFQVGFPAAGLVPL